ncbi:hypothetical protein Poly41_38230 [Novipirellula artificiosorum]|uniref:Uncharacterized protein n=2 Tax=Novipirellula artificiosorum TaxID=2528016 RepID=A0A5C6DGW0_9BACT|nr:hypothetical protein Poly41_38230 [Novipirellula artificiosorum]
MQDRGEDADATESTPTSFRQIMDDENAKCPQKVEDYLTLQYVKPSGTGLFRYEFRYAVSESGRDEIRWGRRWALKAERVKELRNTPLGMAIFKYDLGLDHVFKDNDGIQMLSFTVNKDDMGDPKTWSSAEQGTLAAQPARLAPAIDSSGKQSSVTPGTILPIGSDVKVNPFVQ